MAPRCDDLARRSGGVLSVCVAVTDSQEGIPQRLILEAKIPVLAVKAAPI